MSEWSVIIVMVVAGLVFLILGVTVGVWALFKTVALWDEELQQDAWVMRDDGRDVWFERDAARRREPRD